MKTQFLKALTFLIAMCCARQMSAEPILVTKATSIFTNAAQLDLVAVLAETNLIRADSILKNLPVDDQGTNGGTALWWEANVGNFDAFDYLLKKGARVGNVVTDTYNTLELCAQQEDPRFLEAAIRHGGNVNMIGYFTRQTPIYAAILARTKSNVEMLMKSGAYLNVSDPTGITPILWAAEARAYDLVALLLKKGANTEIRDNSGHSVLEVMREASPKVDHPMYAPYAEAIKLLLERPERKKQSR